MQKVLTILHTGLTTVRMIRSPIKDLVAGL